MGNTVASTIARRLLPAAIALPTLIGWLCLIGHRAGLYSAELAWALFGLSNAIVFAVMLVCGAGLLHRADTLRKQAYEGSQRLARLADLRSRILSVLATSTDDAMYADVLDILREFFQSRYGFFGYVNQDGSLVCPSMTREVWEECDVTNKSIVFPRETWGGLWGRVLLEKKSFYKNEPHQVPKGHLPLVRSLGAPIVNHGNVIGSIHLANRDWNYDEKDREALEGIASMIAPVLGARLQRDREEQHRRRAEEKLRELNEDLEERVRQRTAELHSANDSLRQEISLRQRTATALQQLEAGFRSLFDGVPIGLYRTTPEGRFLDANLALAEMLGFTDRESVLAVNAIDLYANPEDRARWQALMERDEVVVGFEVQFRLRDGTIIWIEDIARAVRDPSGRVLYYEGSTQDISERRRLQESLHALYRGSLEIQTPLNLQERLSRLLRTAQEALELDRVNILLADPEGRWLQAVASTETTDGLRALRVPIGPDGGAIAQAYLTQQPIIWDGRAPLPNGLRLKPPYDGIEAFRSRVFANVPLVVQTKAIGVLGADRKRSRRAFEPSVLDLLQLFASQAAVAIEHAQLFEQLRGGRERLQHLSHRLVEVQEAQRRHIARELHDEVGQLLTGLKLTLHTNVRAPTGPTKARLQRAQALVTDLMARVREMSLNLRPAMLDDLGLLPTLLWHFERYTAQTGVRVTFKHRGLKARRFPTVIETEVFRIVQEALTNVARHSAVREATVRLWADHDRLSAQIEDEGTGFDAEAVMAKGRTIGLVGMRERAGLLGGSLNVESSPGTGTRVTAEIPMEGWIERRQTER